MQDFKLWIQISNEVGSYNLYNLESSRTDYIQHEQRMSHKLQVNIIAELSLLCTEWPSACRFYKNFKSS